MASGISSKHTDSQSKNAFNFFELTGNRLLAEADLDPHQREREGVRNRLSLICGAATFFLRQPLREVF